MHSCLTEGFISYLNGKVNRAQAHTGKGRSSDASVEYRIMSVTVMENLEISSLPYLGTLLLDILPRERTLQDT